MYIPCQIDSRRQNRQVCDQSRDRHCGGRLRRPPPREPPGPDPGPVVASPFNRLSPPAPDCRRPVGAGHGAGHRSWRQQPASAFPRAAGLATDRHCGGRLRRPRWRRPSGRRSWRQQPASAMIRLSLERPASRPIGPPLRRPPAQATVASPFVRLSQPAPVGRWRLGAGHGAGRRSVGAGHGAGRQPLHRPNMCRSWSVQMLGERARVRDANSGLYHFRKDRKAGA